MLLQPAYNLYLYIFERQGAIVDLVINSFNNAPCNVAIMVYLQV